MVERCHTLELDVRKGDGIEHLRSLSPGSIGGFAAIQVVEHLPVSVLEELLSLLRTRVSSGGRILLETINSESLLALARNYFRDPTHVAPLHPDTLRFLVESAGLRVVEIRYQSPFPDGAKLQALDEDAVLGPRARETIKLLNRNTKQLNDILYGFQDYALLAEVP
jgi:O-antigen chain-terminating methyltransferase